MNQKVRKRKKPDESSVKGEELLKPAGILSKLPSVKDVPNQSSSGTHFQNDASEYVDFEEISQSPVASKLKSKGKGQASPSKAPALRRPSVAAKLAPADVDSELDSEQESNENENEHDFDEDLEPDEAELATDSEYQPLVASKGREPLPVSVTLEDEEKALASLPVSDPLKRYLLEVQRHPLLSPEEELRLALRLQNSGDLEAAKQLVSANLRLVVKIAFEYRSLYANVLDLIQEGNIGLMKAVSKYDPAKGARLGYYSSWWIRSYILKYLLDNFRLIKVGTTQAQKKLFYHLLKEKSRIEAQGLVAGPKLLAEKLNVREKDVIEMEHRLSGHGAEFSIDTPRSQGSGDSEGPNYSDLLRDTAEAADHQLEREQLLQILFRRLPAFEKTLNPKETRLLHDRILAQDPKTLQEVADTYGLTRERARQIEARLIQKLRAFIEPDLGKNQE
jgi:RNA polymerase sigma-32 factor